MLNFGAGEVFLHEVHIFNPEGFSVQIIQRSGIGGEGEGQFVGIQSLIIAVVFFIQLAVFAVAQKRMTGMGKLGADLMGPAGNQLALHQSQSVFGNKSLIVGLTGFGTGLGLVRNKNPVLLGILEEVTL